MFNLRKSKEEIERLKMHREQQNRILEQQRSKEIENQKAEEQKIANQVRVFCIRDRIEFHQRHHFQILKSLNFR